MKKLFTIAGRSRGLKLLQWMNACALVGLLLALELLGASALATTTWYASAGNDASDDNSGTAQQPVRTVAKAVSLAKPGDTVMFAAGTYACSSVTVPNGSEDLPVTLRSEGKGKVIFTNDGARTILWAGSNNTIEGIEFNMSSDEPKAAGVGVNRREHVSIRNCRFYAC